MKILVAGATGATGVRLVEELLNRGHDVKAVVRSPEKLPEAVRTNEKLSIIQAAILDLSDEEMKQHVADCDAVASCLGHNLTFKGIYGKPRKLVTDATKRLCEAIKAKNPGNRTKFVLMNTVANSNKDLNEQVVTGQKIMIGILRVILPPQVDNEAAAEYLRSTVGQSDESIEWVAVRPSGLIDSESTSEIEVYASPTRSVLDDGQISRINVGHFMADLITDDALWNEWKGRMPVIYKKGTAIKS